jgi:hypothetical protein
MYWMSLSRQTKSDRKLFSTDGIPRQELVGRIAIESLFPFHPESLHKRKGMPSRKEKTQTAPVEKVVGNKMS